MKLPLKIRAHDAAFIIEDAGGIQIAWLYFDDDATRRGVGRLASREEARETAQRIARALTDGET